VSVSDLAVRIAARILPFSLRDRYREQWSADLRDAHEAGLRPMSIAFAALAFAVTLDRPRESRRLPTAEQRIRRSRLAIGLALSAALLSLSMFPRITFGGMTGLVVWDYASFFLTELLNAYAVLAPITALILVRGARARWSVTLLAIATTAPLAAALIDSTAGYGDYFSAGSGAFAAAGIVITVACGLLWHPSGRNVRTSLMGGIAVWVIAAAGIGYAAVMCLTAATPAGFGEGNEAMYADWIAAELQFRALLVQVLWSWAIVAALLGVLVIVFGRRMSDRRALALGVAAVAVSLIGASGVFGFIELGMSGTLSPVLLAPLRLIAQVMLVSVTLVAVGGVRLQRRRPDSELAPA